MQYGGVVAACGLAAGMELHSTVAPFILRGVTLAGVESALLPRPRRAAAWARLVALLPPDRLCPVVPPHQTVGLAALPDLAAAMLAGQIQGRHVLDLALPT